MSERLIDVDMWVESHERGTKYTRSTGSHGGAGFSQSSHTDRADRADIADRAEAADEANHAKESDHAKTADEANHAKKADEATTADEAYKAYKLLDNYPKFKGVTAEDYLRTKEITSQNIQNSDTITTKNINVTGKATFFELEIQKAKAAGGMTIYSPGAFHVDAVVDAGSYYACYQRAEQDGVKLMQMCEMDDQLMCARFNVGGNGNKFYWMRVAYASPNTVQRVVDGKFVDYLEVMLDKSVKADNCQGVPEVGDALAVVGNRTKEERQSVIVISAYNSLDIELRAPYIAQYENVNNFDLKNKKTTWLAKGENHLTGTFTVVSGGKKVSLDDFVTKISQATFKVEADKITARIDGIEKTQKTTVEKFAQLETIVDSIISTAARKSDLEEVRTEIKQTVESISLKVENGARPNLLWGSDLNLDGVDITSKAAIQKHLGVELAEIGFSEWFEYLKGGGVAGADAIHIKNVYKSNYWTKWTNISWHDVPLKQNTKYTISVWVKFKSYGKKGRMYIDCASDDGRYCFGGYLYKEHYYSRESIDEWQRVRCVFDSGASKKMSALNFCCIADEEEGAQCEIWLCRPKLEEGNTATPWCAYAGTVEALLESGLDIKHRKTIATTDNFVVQNNRGEQTFLVDKNGIISGLRIAQPFNVYNSNEEWRNGKSYSWYINKQIDSEDSIFSGSYLDGACVNIYNGTTKEVRMTINICFKINDYTGARSALAKLILKPAQLFRAIGVRQQTVKKEDGDYITFYPLVPFTLEITNQAYEIAKYLLRVRDVFENVMEVGESYGGIVEKLKVSGIYKKIERLTPRSGYTMKSTDTTIVADTSSYGDANITLPRNPQVGMEVEIINIGTGLCNLETADDTKIFWNETKTKETVREHTKISLLYVGGSDNLWIYTTEGVCGEKK